MQTPNPTLLRRLGVAFAMLAAMVSSGSAGTTTEGGRAPGPALTVEGSIPSLLQQVRIGRRPLVPNTGMTPPEALNHPAPAYTLEALSAGVEGTVTVRGEFDIDGRFTPVDIVEGLGFGLDEAALAALETWTFRPAYRSGRRVPVVADVDVEFRRPLQIGGGIVHPTITSRVSPEYSEEARHARHEGSVILDAIVRSDGTVDVIRIVRELGYGLDEKAVEALGQWKFTPGNRNGEPVDVRLNVQVNFTLR